MLKRIPFFLLVLFALSVNAQDGLSTLKKLHSKYAGNWFKTMTFVQTTEFYRNDSLLRKATWYEALRMPYELRIDFEDPTKGNFVLYKKDSTYRFANNALRNASEGTNPFIFFLGGMYFAPLDDVLAELSKRSFDVSKSYNTEWQGQKVVVIGRSNDKDTSNSIWVDTENWWIVRQIEHDRGRLLDAYLKDHKKLDKGTSETLVEIFLDGKLIQKEKYDQLKTEVELDPNLFEPLHVQEAKHWFKKD